jgi:vacuolar-type H+-ATPase subunit E/Vma4
MVTDTNTAIQKLNELSDQLKKIRYNPDLQKIKKNIESMITELNKQEVIARRTKNKSHCEKILTELNQSLDYLEKLIIMAYILN